MAKREISTTLRNLKFMQRAAQKEEKVKKEVKFEGSVTLNKKCVVIMEGDPRPGAIVGRMSFQSFNPSIDKLNQEAVNDHQPQASTVNSPRENDSLNDGAECSKVSEWAESAKEDYKRKQVFMISEPEYPNKSPKTMESVESQKSNGKSSQKQSKREKLDWRALRPPKPQKG